MSFQPIPPPKGWTPPVEPVGQPNSNSFQERVIPPPIGAGPANLVASQPLSPAMGAIPGGIAGPAIPPPIGGPPAHASLGPYGSYGQFQQGNYSPPVGSYPAAHPMVPPIGADPETVLASQQVSPPVGSAPTNLLGQPLPPPMGWAPSTNPNQQMIPPPIGGPSAKQLRGEW